MTTTGFTHHASGTRRYLPERITPRRIHRWLRRPLSAAQLNALSVGIVAAIVLMLGVAQWL